MTALFVGLDVQCSRGCPFAVLDGDGKIVEDGWIDDGNPATLVQRLKLILKARCIDERAISIAIDAPRMPLEVGRQWHWKNGCWKQCSPKAGRHCEIVIKNLNLANPQWTPLCEPYPGWMSLGFSLFTELGAMYRVCEVFPSASYTMLADDPSAQISICLGQLKPGPKDMLDAYIAAATLRDFLQGRGCEVGGGDGLGTIILPRRVPNASGVLMWPTPEA